MSEQSYVSDVLVVADGNPRGGVVTFHFSPASGVAEANSRIRLAGTQNVIAVAKMNDGSFFKASKQVKVTIGGCGGWHAGHQTVKEEKAASSPMKLDKKGEEGRIDRVKALVSTSWKWKRKDQRQHPAQDSQVHCT
jgi:hypothetical protein